MHPLLTAPASWLRCRARERSLPGDRAKNIMQTYKTTLEQGIQNHKHAKLQKPDTWLSRKEFTPSIRKARPVARAPPPSWLRAQGRRTPPPPGSGRARECARCALAGAPAMPIRIHVNTCFYLIFQNLDFRKTLDTPESPCFMFATRREPKHGFQVFFLENQVSGSRANHVRKGSWTRRASGSTFPMARSPSRPRCRCTLLYTSKSITQLTVYD